jgi:hypothetical protein
MAVGEDLVEILIDPTGQGSAPEDLYRLVIKPSGVHLAEKGISVSPPLGRTVPWPGRATVAVHRGAKAWTIEVAIPLQAFGPQVARNAFWGLNVCRFAPQGRESSSWAACDRYYYHPRNLGTMYLMPAKKSSDDTD